MKGSGCGLIEGLHQHLDRGTAKDLEKPHLWLSVSGPRFEQGTFRIQEDDVTD
jgi:hypothetical protein